MEHKKCLVLNLDYTPMNIENSLRAFVIYCKGHAEYVNSYDRSVYSLKSAKQVFDAPLVIRINRFYKIPHRSTSLNKHNIFKRDENKCVYCGSTKDLNIDHVIPKSKGGRDTWKNLVTSCRSCNSIKADNIIDPRDVNGKELKIYQPHFLLMMQKSIVDIPEEWKPYLFL